MEAAYVFDRTGAAIYWHLPENRSQGAIPDSQKLWEVLWEGRHILGGVAHTHPWHGAAWPSDTDVTTFSAVEKGLGRRLMWPIITFSTVSYYAWKGPGDLDYSNMERRRIRLFRDDIDRLRVLSGGGGTP